MNRIATRCLHKLRYIYLNKYPNLMPEDIPDNYISHYHYQDQQAGDYIKELLIRNQPCMISRLGATEMSAIITYLNIVNSKNLLKDSLLYIRGKIGYFWWEDDVVNNMCNASGFFPADKHLLYKFCERTIQDIQNIDVLGSWLNGEQFVSSFLHNAVRVPLIDLEPYCHEHPWSEVLNGKTVLVIHPFEHSIQSQYLKRKLLFKQPNILPDFELKTIKAIQSIAGNNANFNNWFDALNHMCDQIVNTQFDIAIIGAGAYGLPLAAFVKKLGKKAIHLGGATQILFGIRGARWDERLFYQQLFNEHWVRPLTSETPQNFTRVEEGCYW
ncbi:hypothetical protein [Calothrix sp. PCC 7507]|uniref:hypothetical protein n=1 Tax=Calothrix sp. PCC 7507 TaxID=99598 RepID=UPI00029F458C|nr:hypothetical protein [Calothrix sp. PCC 7507]AFY30871.1 hypothetical protein Cal7507_0375 [Calothrix sp. PCC 7507]